MKTRDPYDVQVDLWRRGDISVDEFIDNLIAMRQLGRLCPDPDDN